MLDFSPKIPGVVTYAETVEHSGRIPNRAGIVPAEIIIVQPTAFAVLRGVGQVAIRYVVPVRIVPRTTRAELRSHDRIIVVRDPVSGLLEVAAQRHLQRGAAGAEQVVRNAHSRIE